MEINVSQPLLDLEGDPLRHPDTKEPWTVGMVLITVSLGTPPQGTTYTETESTARYMTALDIRDAIKKGNGSTVDIPIEMASKLKADIVRSFGPIVAGQMSPLLNGSPGRPN